MLRGLLELGDRDKCMIGGVGQKIKSRWNQVREDEDGGSCGRVKNRNRLTCDPIAN